MAKLLLLTLLLAAPAVARGTDPLPTGEALAAVVEREFPAHDRDADGKLDRTEFSAWMVALKARSDPATRASSPKTKAWIAGAFALADRDRSAGVTEAELTGLLERARS